ncbi:hypothetical protein Tco_0104060 [Tanacetum coccineum]
MEESKPNSAFGSFDFRPNLLLQRLLDSDFGSRQCNHSVRGPVVLDFGNSKVREPCQRLLYSDFGSGQYNHSVRGPVVLDFGNSDVRFASCEPLGTVGHSESYIGRDFGNSDVRSASCEPSNTIGCSENYIGGGPMLLDSEKCVVRSVGDDTDLVGVEACNYRNRGGCKVVGSSFVGDYYVDYSRQSGSVWSTGGISSANFSQKQKLRGVCKRQERKRARSLRVGNDGGEFGDIMLDIVNHGGVTYSYIDIGDCHWVCEHCRATFWYGERVKRHGNRDRRQYHKCCAGGKVICSSSQLDPEVVSNLIRILDDHNELVKLFRTARDRLEAGEIPDF